MAHPTRKSVLLALDVAMGERHAPAAGRLGPQFAEFRDQNGSWIEDDRLVGYGYPGSGGFYKARNGPPKVALYTENDEKAQQLRERAPETLRFPGSSSDIAVEVVNIGTVTPSFTPTARHRPVCPGVSVSNAKLKIAGTLGAFVKKRSTEGDAPFLLSCNHVLTEYNNPPARDSIVQPSTLDGGKMKDQIAELSDSVPLEFHDRRYNNTVDAALGRMLDSASCDCNILHLGRPQGVSDTIRRGMRVRMFGRTSGYSTGDVLDPAARLRLRYPHRANATSYVGFSDIVLCTPFSRSGDSGAAVLSEKNEVVGMIMAGGDRASVFCKMKNVCNLLDIDLLSVAP